MSEPKLKTFRIIFKDGKSLTVKAHSFDVGKGHFYKAPHEPDHSIYLRFTEVVAIVPEEPDDVPGGFA